MGLVNICNRKSTGIVFSIGIILVVSLGIQYALGESKDSVKINSASIIATSNSTNHFVQLGETQVADKYKKDIVKERSNQWFENYYSIQRTIPQNEIENNVVLKYASKPPQLSAELVEKYKKHLSEGQRPHPKILDDGKYYAAVPTNAILVDKYQNEIQLPKSFPVRAATSLQSHALTGGSRTIISEPAVANHGNVVFMTGNWWAARSTNGGNTFSFIDPFSDFANFCCDQDVVYSDNHNLWVWYRMGAQDPSLGDRNIGKIGVSSNDGASWCFFNINATMIDPGLVNHWLDYPNMQVTKDKLYLSTNIFSVNFPSDPTVYTAMLRFDLKGLENCANTTFDVYLTSTEFNFTPVNGATDTMYFATQLSGNSSKIYKWPDSSNTLSSNIVNYTTYPTSGYSCTVTNGGNNPCGRSDSRVLGGYLSHGIIGFVWDAAQGGAFLYPYEDYIRVNETSGALIDNPIIYSATSATNFANIGVNEFGDLGIGLFHMGGSQNPAYLVGIHDALTSGSGFDFTTVKTSTNGPGSNDAWGDFVRVKPFKPDNGKWVASGYTLQGGSDDSHVENLYVIFGRPDNLLFCGKPLAQYDAFINGTSGDDVLVGTGGNDLMLGQGGNDRIFGKAGNDCIIALGNGSNYISGGAGNDTITAGDGANKIWGGGGNDNIFAGNGNNRIVAGSSLSSGDLVEAGSGNNTIWAGPGPSGVDTVITQPGGFNTCIAYLPSFSFTGCQLVYVK